MSLSSVIGQLDLTLSVPGTLIANEQPIAEGIKVSYANERLKLSFIPLDRNGNELKPFHSVNQLTYSRGSFSLIGKETARNISYSATYYVLKHQLRVSIAGKVTTLKVKNLVEAFGSVTRLIVNSVPRSNR